MIAHRVVLVFVLMGWAGLAAADGREVRSFNADWLFHLGDVPGGEAVDLADAEWRRLDVPHDWSIEGSFARTNPTGAAGGWLPAGVGWYRKHVQVPAQQLGRRWFVEFDGVMADSTVWVNGRQLGRRPCGYASFRYELTADLRPGDNVLAVRADNSVQPASRWYTGAGIYRHVRLVVCDPVHLEHWGTFITTPTVSAQRATVRVQSEVVNQSTAPRTVALAVTLTGPDGRRVSSAQTAEQTVEAGKSAVFEQELIVTDPQRWDVDAPHLYQAAVEVRQGQAVLDNQTIRFGIREIRYESDTGFWLNGRNLKLKGVCLHHDGGAVGAAVPKGLLQRRLALMKELGANAVRTAHNPPDPVFLDVCDELGLLVMDELFDCWTVAKTRGDYARFFRQWHQRDARDAVLRDRNHPSVIMYSAGNEIHDTPNAVLANEILAGLVQIIHEADPTRWVTQGLFRPNQSRDFDNGLADRLDIIGVNYRDTELLAAWRAQPSRKILVSESAHGRQNWLNVRDNPPHGGQFLWTGIDYLGEAGAWPNIGQAFGLVDRAGVVRALGYERQSWWAERPVVTIARLEPGSLTIANNTQGGNRVVNWTPRRGEGPQTVEVYSNAQEVELLLNDRSLGTRSLNRDLSPRVWNIPWAAGTLRAVARNGGRVVATHELRSAGPPEQILLTADQPAVRAGDFDDVVVLTVLLADAAGVPHPWASGGVSFRVEGPGTILGVDNGDLTSLEPFKASSRTAYNSRCIALVRATGPGRITVTATAPELAQGQARGATASVSIEAVPPAQ